MENFWMYQVEKLEEEQAKQKQETEQHDRDEVWTACDDFSLACWFELVAVVVSFVSAVLWCVERSGIAQRYVFMRTDISFQSSLVDS